MYITDQSPFQFQNGFLSLPNKIFHRLHIQFKGMSLPAKEKKMVILVDECYMLILTPRRWTSIDLRSASLFVRRLLNDDFPGRR